MLLPPLDYRTLTSREREQIIELLRCAASERSSLCGAANILEDRAKAGGVVLDIPASDVVLAIRARETVQSGRPAGGYWDDCLDAATRAEGGQ